jgi:hypothetical protein
VRRIDPDTTFAQVFTQPEASIEVTIASRDDRDADFGRSASLLDSSIHIALKRQLNSLVWPISWWDMQLDRCDGPCQAPKSRRF